MVVQIIFGILEVLLQSQKPQGVFCISRDTIFIRKKNYHNRKKNHFGL